MTGTPPPPPPTATSVILFPTRYMSQPQAPQDGLTTRQIVQQLRRPRPIRHVRRDYIQILAPKSSLLSGPRSRPAAADALRFVSSVPGGQYVVRVITDKHPLSDQDPLVRAGYLTSGRPSHVAIADTNDHRQQERNARSFARGAGVQRRSDAVMKRPRYFSTQAERLYAEAKTSEQNTFRFSLSGDPCLFSVADPGAATEFFRPQGAQLCSPQWASGGNVTRIVAGQNDVLRYRWITGQVFDVPLTPSDPLDPTDFYSIYTLCADLERAMFANQHFFTTPAAPTTPQYLLRIMYDVRTGRIVVESSILYRDDAPIAPDFFADKDTTVPFLQALSDAAPPTVTPSLVFDDTDASRAFAIAIGAGPTVVDTADAAKNTPELSSSQFALPFHRIHLFFTSRVTPNMPVIPHLYSNRAFAVSGGSVDASANIHRHQVQSINTTAGHIAKSSFGLGLANALVYQKSIQYPWTLKSKLAGASPCHPVCVLGTTAAH